MRGSFKRGRRIAFTLAALAAGAVVALASLASASTSADATDVLPAAPKVKASSGQVTVFGVDMTTTTEDSLTGASVTFQNVAPSTTFTSDDLAEDVAAIDCDGDATACDGVQLYRDDGATPDALDASDTAVSTGFAFTGTCGSGASCIATLTLPSTAVPEAAEGSYTFLIAIRTSESIADGDVFRAQLGATAFTVDPIINSPIITPVTSKTITADTTLPATPNVSALGASVPAAKAYVGGTAVSAETSAVLEVWKATDVDCTLIAGKIAESALIDLTATNADLVDDADIGALVPGDFVCYRVRDAAGNVSEDAGAGFTPDGGIPAQPTLTDVGLLGTSNVAGVKRIYASTDSSGPRTFRLAIKPGGSGAAVRAVTESATTFAQVTTSISGGTTSGSTDIRRIGTATTLAAADGVAFGLVNANGNEGALRDDGTIPAAPATPALDGISTSAATGHQRVTSASAAASTFGLALDPAGATAWTRAVTTSGGSTPVRLASGATSSGTTAIFSGTTALDTGAAVGYTVVDSSANESDATAKGTIPAPPVPGDIKYSDGLNAFAVSPFPSGVEVDLYVGAAAASAPAAYDGTPDGTATSTAFEGVAEFDAAQTLYYTAVSTTSGNESTTAADGAIPAAPAGADLGLLAVSAAGGNQRVTAATDASGPRTYRLYLDPAAGVTDDWSRAVTTSGGSVLVEVTTSAGGAASSGTTAIFGGADGTTALAATHVVGHSLVDGNGNDSDPGEDGSIPAAPSAADASVSDALNKFTVSSATTSFPVNLYVGGYDPAGADGTATSATPAAVDEPAQGASLSYTTTAAASGNESAITSDGTIPSSPTGIDTKIFVSAAEARVTVSPDTSSRTVRLYADPVSPTGTAWVQATTTDTGTAAVQVTTSTSSTVQSGVGIFVNGLALGGDTAVSYSRVDSNGNDSEVVADGSVPATPADPAEFSANAANGTATVASTAPSGKYRVFRGTTSASGRTTHTNGTPTDISVTGLTGGDTVGYAVTQDATGGNESKLLTDGLIPSIGAPDLQTASDSGSSTTDNITFDTTPTFDVTSQDGATVTLFDGGSSVGEAAATGGTATITPSALADGPHSFTARASNANGNISVVSSATSVTIDTLAPDATAAPDLQAASDSGSSSTDDTTNDDLPTFDIAGAETGAVVTAYDGATPIGEATAASTVSITSTADLADGAHSITATATDVAGNVSAASSALSITIDTLAPAAPGTPDLQIASDSGISNADDVTNDTTPTLDVSGAEAASLVSILDGGSATGAPATASGGGDATVTTAALSDGVRSLTAKSTDAAGNTSDASSALSVTIDTAVPTLAAPDLVAASDTGVSNTDNLTNDATPTFAVTAEPSAAVEIREGATPLGSGTAGGDGVATIDSSALIEGGHEITALATDVAGNASAVSPAITVNIDVTAPAATPAAPDLQAGSDTGFDDEDGVTFDATPTFDVSGSAPGDFVTLFEGATALGTATVGESGVASPESSTLTDGTHTIVAKGSDAAGNLTPASGSLDVKVDTVAPAAPSTPDLQDASDTGSSPTDNTTNDDLPTLDIAGAETGALVIAYDGATPIGEATAASTVSITSTVDLGDGAHSITATATDLAGNVSALSSALSITIDTAAPATPGAPDLQAASDTGQSSIDNITIDATPTFSVTGAEPGSTVALLEGIASLGTETADGSGDAVLTVSLAEGAHTVTANSTDLAGNSSASSPSLGVTVDITAPATPGTPDLAAASDSGSSATDDVTNDTTPTFSVTAETDATVTLLEGTDVLGSGLAGGGTASVTSVVLGQGTHNVKARATDVAGNDSGADSATLPIEIDSVAPAPPSAIDLQSSSDSGTSSTDNVTKITSPTFLVTGAPAGSTVTIFEGATARGTGTANGSGQATITTAALANGVHTLTASSVDPAGNTSTGSPALAVTIDTTPPTVVFTTPTTLTGKPVAVFGENVSPVTNANFVLRVLGTTTNVPASVSYNAATRTATLTPFASLTAGQRYVLLVPPPFQPAPADVAGNSLASASRSFRASTVEQETSVGSRYFWPAVFTSSAHGGSYTLEHKAARTATFAFTGSSITWYTVTGPSQGIAAVYIDGVRKPNVQNYAASTTYKVARTYSGLSAGTHRIAIVTTGLKAAAAKDTFVAVDAFKVGTTLITQPSLVYLWQPVSVGAASGGAYRQTDLGGSTVFFTFRGTGIDWYTVLGPAMGKANIYIDGAYKGTVDNYRSSALYNVRRSYRGLADGVHTVRIVVLGLRRPAAAGSFIAVDRFVVI